MYAYVDETGNTGDNLFDAAQPFFLTGALITRMHFDVLYRPAITALAKAVGTGSFHANELGLAKIEDVAEPLLRLLKKADARFVLSSVEKKYLAVTKIVDHVFDSGENLAVPWQAFNLRPLRLMLVFKVGSIVDVQLAKAFWDALMEPKKNEAHRKFTRACEELLSRVNRLPDERSRDVVSQALKWAIQNPEAFTIHSATKDARYGHLPNMVAFRNLIDGIEIQSQRWNRSVRLIVHDEQLQFEKNLKLWHELYSNASSEPLHWPGEEPRILRTVPGSKLHMSTDNDSVGIQVIDIVLWVFKRFVQNKPLGANTCAFLNFIANRTWYQDLSFEFVGRQLEGTLDRINSAELSDDQIRKGAELREFERRRREQAMLDYAEAKKSLPKS